MKFFSENTLDRQKYFWFSVVYSTGSKDHERETSGFTPIGCCVSSILLSYQDAWDANFYTFSNMNIWSPTVTTTREGGD